MKKKDFIILAVSALIFVVTGVVGYNTLNPKKSAAGKVVQVEVAPVISQQFDSNSLNQLEDGSTNVNFYQNPDLSSGHPNQKFFGAF
jgi:hypothetical protein